MDAGSLALGACGGLLILFTLADLFATVFAYDGFTLWAPHFQHLLWRGARSSAVQLPPDAQHASLSLASAMLLPATLIMWLALETAAFALIFFPGIRSGAFTISHGSGRGIDAAFYLAGGDLSSLTFGDYVPHTDFFRAMVDIETMIGLATFTLGLTYVLTAFGAHDKLNSLHARVRRNAVEPHRPATIIKRLYRQGDASRLASFLQALAEDVEDYDEALRRYPVAFYFHTRRLERSTPRIFDALGELIELLHWGLPCDDPITHDPALLALTDSYNVTLDRLRRSFVGPAEVASPAELRRAQFDAVDSSSGPRADLKAIEDEARTAAGLPPSATAAGYEQYCEWWEFHAHRIAVMSRVSDALGYDSRSTI